MLKNTIKLLLILAFNNLNGVILNTLYGDFDITEPVLIDLLNDPYMQRLREIRQYGVRVHALKKEDFNRYDHSVGVMVLLRKFGANLNEQIAGLLHDVSHTVFSHVGDNIFYQTSLGNAYQDNIFENFIYRTSLSSVLNEHNIGIKDISKKKKFRALEQDLPDICCDRLEYNLRGGIVEGLINQNDVDQILADIKFEDNIWFFSDSDIAKKFANISLYHTENIWGSAREYMIYKWAEEAIKRALIIDLFTLNAFHFSTDNVIWQKLTQSQDKYIAQSMHKILNHEKYFELVTGDDYSFIAKQKFRGINPLVKVYHKLVRLTEIDSEFNKEFTRVKTLLEAGYRIKVINPA